MIERYEIYKNHKVMKNQIECNDKQNKNMRDHCPIRRLAVLRILLCLCVAVTAISCCALFGISCFKARTRAMINDSEMDKIRIYIDQGHNPHPHHNTGAEGNGLYEQDLTYEIGCFLAVRLEADGRFAVCLSRPDEETVLGTDIASSLNARVEGAVNFEADYMISLHINSFTQDTVNGIEVFISGYDSESYFFGQSLLDGLLASTGLANRGMKRDAELYVLKNAAMPAVLVEMGFISNATDAALLSEHPEQFAQGIYAGISDYFENAYSPYLHVLLWIIGISGVLAMMLIFAVFHHNHSHNREKSAKSNAQRSDTSC